MTQMWKEICQQPEVLGKCLYNSELIRKAANAAAGADIRSVVIAARGTSDHAAIYAKYLIEFELGIPVSLAAPSILTTYKAKMDYSGCLVIAISQSGKAQDVLEVIRQAETCGAITLGITNNTDSPIAKAVNYHIYSNAGPEKSVAATKTFTAQLMCAAIFIALWKKDKELQNRLEAVPYMIDKIISSYDQINHLAAVFKDMENCFTLARGINYPIALEAALKIQETCYVEAKGFAVSDFYHGPIAMVDETSSILLFSPEGPAFEDSSQLYEKVAGLGAKILLISDNDQLISSSKYSFSIPKADDDMISAFSCAVFSQIFACCLSVAIGLDPDAPRSLKKVTITK